MAKLDVEGKFVSRKKRRLFVFDPCFFCGEALSRGGRARRPGTAERPNGEGR